MHKNLHKKNIYINKIYIFFYYVKRKKYIS
ncbi:hypothetical protein PFUGPA_03187 [Plasmodium falciparum Palo Alto/Uganda]|uniref:Uncharacterized protein n=1 Tax=Plasmodium falciparum (isolate Palo Alto / Uganda) TaxID=57270 RepID=W4IXQ7_PLAFP|nr:hypothetical protein PFUGPA_03187 [Plasmodium falciparum Palo Alto/Uganda]